MKLLQWTLFVDMLGYREANGAICSDKDAEEFITFMETNKKILDYSNRSEVQECYKEDEFDLYEYYDIHSCFVSDSIIITYKPKDVERLTKEEIKFMHSANALFIICMRLQTLIFHCFVEKGIFLRGGISSKYAYIKDNFAVGEGVIEAYVAESSIAKNPRIVLHPSVEENRKLMEKIKFLSDLMYGGRSIIKKDEGDGILFLDYIGFALSSSDLKSAAVARSAEINPLMFVSTRMVTVNYVRRHYESLSSKLNDIKNRLGQAENGSKEYEKISGVLEKFLWLKEYHNQSIADVKELSAYVIV